MDDNSILLVLLILALIGSCIYVIKQLKQEKEEKLKEKKQKEFKQKYLEENNVPKNANLLCCTNITVKDMLIEGNWNVFVWKDEDTFNFCGATENDGIQKTTISIKDIQFYKREGDYRVETAIEGGGVNFIRAIIIGLVGAFIGSFIGEMIDAINFRIFTSSGLSTVLAIIFFILGALLGGKNKTVTQNREIDNRKTYLNYTKNNKNKRMVFTSNAYEIICQLMPEKEMSYIENNKIVESDKNKNDNIYKDIEKLAELRDKGILTEEEFNNKKELLLNRI